MKSYCSSMFIKIILPLIILFILMGSILSKKQKGGDDKNIPKDNSQKTTPEVSKNETNVSSNEPEVTKTNVSNNEPEVTKIENTDTPIETDEIHLELDKDITPSITPAPTTIEGATANESS